MLPAVQWFTDFGDQGIVLPASAAIAGFLLLSRWWRAAASWVLAVAGVLGVMLVLKLGFGACGWELGIPGLNSPSGHTASATVLYGGASALFLPGLRGLSRVLPAVLIAVLFAASRVLLHDHSILEVSIGGGVGLCGVGLLARLCRPVPPGIRLAWLSITVAVVAVAAHGNRMTAEQHIHSFATLWLRARLCPMPG